MSPRSKAATSMSAATPWRMTRTRRILTRRPCSAVCPTTVASARTGGVVKRGKIMFRYADHDEVFEAGDAYYGAPGHLPLLCAGTEPIEFSPTDALKRTMDVLGTNLEAAKASTVSATQ